MREECAGYIRLTFVDELSNEFVTLGGAGFLTDADLKEQWAKLPRTNGNSNFIADLLDPDGSILDDRPVTFETIESVTGEPIQNLIAKGRLELINA